MTNAFRRFAAPLYLVAALFVFTPLLDVFLNVWPWRPGLAEWRYGAVGAAANYLVSMVFGGLLASLTASACGHRRALRVVAAASWVVAGVLAALILEFVLDVAQLQARVAEDDRRGFQLGATKAVIKYATSALCLGVIGWAGWKGAREMPRQAEDRSDAVLVRGA
jgi:hypothetical protein